MRMCRGMFGGWLGGSVVGLGGSACPGGARQEEAVLGGWRDLTLGGDGGMWEGGEARDSVDVCVGAELLLLSVFSSLRAAGGTRA